MNKKLLQSIIVLLFVAFLSINLFAQNFYMRQRSGTWISGELNLPQMDVDSEELSGWNAALNLKLRTSPNVYLLAELPVAYGKVDYGSIYGRNVTGIGNVFVGLQFLTNTKGLTFEAGVRVPTTKEEDFFTLQASVLNDIEKYSSFIPKMWNVTILPDYQFNIANEFYGNVSFGPNLLMPSDEDYGDTELYANYQFGAGYKNKLVNLSARIMGFMILSESNLDFDERTYHHFVLSASVTFDKIEPGIILRFPMDEFSPHDFIFGLNAGFKLGD